LSISYPRVVDVYFDCVRASRARVDHVTPSGLIGPLLNGRQIEMAQTTLFKTISQGQRKCFPASRQTDVK